MSGAAVTGDCEPLDVGAENQTQIICKTRWAISRLRLCFCLNDLLSNRAGQGGLAGNLVCSCCGFNENGPIDRLIYLLSPQLMNCLEGLGGTSLWLDCEVSKLSTRPSFLLSACFLHITM